MLLNCSCPHCTCISCCSISLCLYAMLSNLLVLVSHVIKSSCPPFSYHILLCFHSHHPCVACMLWDHQHHGIDSGPIISWFTLAACQSMITENHSRGSLEITVETAGHYSGHHQWLLCWLLLYTSLVITISIGEPSIHVLSLCSPLIITLVTMH